MLLADKVQTGIKITLCLVWTGLIFVKQLLLSSVNRKQQFLTCAIKLLHYASMFQLAWAICLLLLV